MIDNRLRTFVALCRNMNYRKTAEELNMTQPAVTQHIQYLEKMYGCKLFKYDRRRLAMTSKAEILKNYAENVLYQENRLTEQLNRQEGWDLSIGATKTIGEYVIPDVIAAYLADERNALSVEVDNTEHLLQRLSDGTLDFALIEGAFDRTTYAYKLYRKEPFMGLCARMHPFAGKTIPLNALWDEHLILREEGSGTRNILEQMLAEQNHTVKEFRRITTFSNFGLMTKLLPATGGITFAYQAVLDQTDHLAPFHVNGWKIVREFNYVFLDTPFSREAVEYFDSQKRKRDG